jgi:hypothetical protein
MAQFDTGNTFLLLMALHKVAVIIAAWQLMMPPALQCSV